MVKSNYIFVILVIVAILDFISSKPICHIIGDDQAPLPSFEKISKRAVRDVDLSSPTALHEEQSSTNTNSAAAEENLLLTTEIITLVQKHNIVTNKPIKCDYREEESYRL